MFVSNCHHTLQPFANLSHHWGPMRILLCPARKVPWRCRPRGGVIFSKQSQWNYMGVEPKIGVFTPQIIHLFIGFSIIFTIHFFWGKKPYVWKHPYSLVKNSTGKHTDIIYTWWPSLYFAIFVFFEFWDQFLGDVFFFVVKLWRMTLTTATVCEVRSAGRNSEFVWGSWLGRLSKGQWLSKLQGVKNNNDFLIVLFYMYIYIYIYKYVFFCCVGFIGRVL